MARFYSDEEIEFLKENAPKFGAKICAEKLGRKVESVRYKLSSLGISSKKDNSITQEDIDKLIFKSSFKKLELDFSKTDTPKELAYFLGFFWADGYNKPKDKALVIEIVEEDGITLEPIFMRLATFSIYKRIREGRKPQMTFYYKDKELFELINNLGKYPKSIESHQKIFEYIPEEYWIYFLRGLIDGDGCWYTSDSGATQFSICGAKDFNWEYLRNVLINKYNFNCRVEVRMESERGNSSIIRNTNTTDINKFIDQLYKIKDLIWLPRKYSKCMYIKNKKYE